MKRSEALALAVRSLYRLQLMKDDKYPQIMIDTEKAIWSKRWSELTPEEQTCLNQYKEEFLKQEQIEFEERTIRINAEVEKEMKYWN